MPPETRVFVYGSLLRGERNHDLLADARFVGKARTERGYALVDLGAYPGMVREGDGRVAGELYDVDAATLARLDQLEGVPRIYVRDTVRLDGGGEALAYRYVAEPASQRPRVAGGDWRRRTRPSERPTWHVGRWLFLRGLGLTFLIAFASLWVQLAGLYGSRGIAPIDEILWLEASDSTLSALAAAGVALALLLIADVAPAVCALLLWAIYLAFTDAGGPFLSFQWDVLLIEAGFLGVLVAPWRVRPRPSRDRAPPLAALLLVRWLLLRLMLLSGLVKLLSGDPTWRELTALRFHYWTQPLPGPLSRFAHELPAWFHSAEAVAMFAIELVLPLFVFGPRVLQRAAFAGFVALQVMITATGNYGFFTLLTVALCLPLLDDDAWRRVTPARLRARGPFAADPALLATRARRLVLAPLALAIALLGAAEGVERCVGWPATPDWMQAALLRFARLRTVNSYGLFAVMTTERREIVVEGSDGGSEWKVYEFRYKPGALDRRPPWVGPHMPRLDWQMWFAALGSYERNPWFLAFLQRVLEGSPEVLSLLAENPFPDGPPRYLRATMYDYRFAPSDEGANESRWWQRERLGLYCPIVMLAGGELVRAR